MADPTPKERNRQSEPETKPAKKKRPPMTREARRRQTTWIITAVLALAAIVTAVVLAQDGSGTSDVDAADLGQDERPVGLDEQTLREFAMLHEGPIYWAGPRADTTYELTVTEVGDIFIRYLPLGVAVGNQQPDFLTVATYTRPDAYQALVEVSLGDQFVSEETASGALVVYANTEPTSAHFSFPDTTIQVEVFDPAPNRAVSLVLDGSITLLG